MRWPPKRKDMESSVSIGGVIAQEIAPRCDLAPPLDAAERAALDSVLQHPGRHGHTSANDRLPERRPEPVAARAAACLLLGHFRLGLGRFRLNPRRRALLQNLVGRVAVE